VIREKEAENEVSESIKPQIFCFGSLAKTSCFLCKSQVQILAPYLAKNIALVSQGMDPTSVRPKHFPKIKSVALGPSKCLLIVDRIVRVEEHLKYVKCQNALSFLEGIKDSL